MIHITDLFSPITDGLRLKALTRSTRGARHSAGCIFSPKLKAFLGASLDCMSHYATRKSLLGSGAVASEKTRSGFHTPANDSFEMSSGMENEIQIAQTRNGKHVQEGGAPCGKGGGGSIWGVSWVRSGGVRRNFEASLIQCNFHTHTHTHIVHLAFHICRLINNVNQSKPNFSCLYRLI